MEWLLSRLTMLLLIIAVVLTLCALALSRIGRRSDAGATLGSMSERWIAENRASRHEQD